MVKIGVILDENNKLTTLMDGVKIAIYENIDLKWTKTREVKETFRQKATINKMRVFLSLLILELHECKILIGTNITGIPYMILDKAGFILCEAQEMSEILLSSVASDYERKEQNAKSITVFQLEDYPTAPIKTQIPGVYEFDMRRFQKQYPEISSKKVLLPFIRKGEFSQLHIFCNHVMPWLDFELPVHGLKYCVERLEENDYKVLIDIDTNK